MSATTPATRPPAPHGLPRLLHGLDDSGTAVSLVTHEARYGSLPDLHPAQLIESVEASGLRGRGGADFPTSRKLRAVAERRGAKVVVVNGSETEPGSLKDRLLLGRLPHLVLDGAELAAAAVGAREVVIKLPVEAAETEDALAVAIDERPRRRLQLSVASGASGYVAGEETAVINLLGGGRPIPTFVPPRPFERGLRGRPTLVQNPETLAQIALVARYGPGWYRELGTEDDPGCVLVSISGAVRYPGVYELAFGTPLRELLAAAGGTVEPLQALLVGGLFGAWVAAEEALDLGLSRSELRSVGCSLGSGVLFALGQSACGVHESARVIQYLAAESSGQCGPCVHGLADIAEAYGALADGRAHPSEQELMLRWCTEVTGRGACRHPDGAVRFVRSALEVFGAGRGHSRARCPAAPAGLLSGGTYAT